MKAKAFYEVLEEQIRSDLRKEIEAEVRGKLAEELRKAGLSQQGVSSSEPAARSTAFERLETWLASHVNRPNFSQGPRARRTYGTSAPPRRPSAPGDSHASGTTHATEAPAGAARSELVYEVKTVEEICALELLRRHGARVNNRFTASELKTAWRKAALQTHPDRFTTADSATQARMSAAFRELCEAYEMLQTSLDAGSSSGREPGIAA